MAASMQPGISPGGFRSSLWHTASESRLRLLHRLEERNRRGPSVAWPRGLIFALAAGGHSVYAGGRLLSAGDEPAAGVAAWDWQAERWSSFGNDHAPNFWVQALTPSGGRVYIGGAFYTVGGMVANGVAVYNPSAGLRWGPALPLTQQRGNWPSITMGGYTPQDISTKRAA